MESWVIIGILPIMPDLQPVPDDTPGRPGPPAPGGLDPAPGTVGQTDQVRTSYPIDVVMAGGPVAASGPAGPPPALAGPPISAAETRYITAARAANTLRGYRSDWNE